MVSEQHLRVFSDGGDRHGALIYSDGILAAIFSQLISADRGGSEPSGAWQFEAGFGPCRLSDRMAKSFSTLVAASDWVDAVIADAAGDRAPEPA